MAGWVPKVRTLQERLNQAVAKTESEELVSPITPSQDRRLDVPETRGRPLRTSLRVNVETPTETPVRAQVEAAAPTPILTPSSLPLPTPAREAIARPPSATLPEPEEPIVDKPIWARALEAFAAPFEWVQDNLLNPVTAVLLDPIIPDLKRLEGEGYVDWKERSRDAWNAPGVDIPVPWGRGTWRVDLKGVAELAPWLLIPGAGQVGGVTRGVGVLGRVAKSAPWLISTGQKVGLAGKVGQIPKVGRALGGILEASPWGLTEKAAAFAIRKPTAAIFKGFDKASEAVGRRVFGQYVGKPAPKAVQEITELMSDYGTDVLAGKKTSIKALRDRQAALVHQARNDIAAGRKPTDEAARAYSIALKGGADLPTIPAEGLARLRPETYDELTEILAHSGLSDFDTIRTQFALEKLLKGRADFGAGVSPIGTFPTPAEMKLMGRAFGLDFQDAARQLLAAPPGAKAKFIDTANFSRTVLASWDISATFRQGLVLGLRSPKAAANAFKKQIRAFTSEKWALEADDALRMNPKFAEFERNGGFIAPLKKGAQLNVREESFMSAMAEKVPGVRRSERAYITYLNELRMATYESTSAAWRAMGAKDVDMKGLATFINAASGRGSLPRSLENISPMLNATMFSPRLQLSRLQLPAMLGSPNKYVRMEAAKALGTFLGAGTGLVSMLSMLPGVELNLADPRSADFGKLKVGETRFDIWTGYAQYARFIAQMLTGERKTAYGNMTESDRLETIARFAQSKASPAVGLFLDLIKGETYMGEEIVGETANMGRQVRNRLMPLFLQDMIDAVEEQGANGILYGAPAALGVGVLTYTNEFAQARDRAAKTRGADKWEDLDPASRLSLELTDSELQTAMVIYDRNVMGTQWGDYNLTGRSIESMYTDMVDRAAAQYQTTNDGKLFREKVEKADTARRGAYDSRQTDPRFAELVARMETPRTDQQLALMGPEQVAIGAYNDAMYADDMYDEFGDYRYDLYDKRREILRKDMGDELFDYIEDYRGQKKEHLPAIYQELATAKTVLRPYWAIKTNVEAIFGVPRTPGEQRRVDAQVSRLRKNLRRTNPLVEKYFQMFYTEPTF